MASFPQDVHSSTPPVLPPKPGSQNASRINTPPASAGLAPDAFDGRRMAGAGAAQAHAQAQQPQIPDPGEQWLPQMLQDKSTKDLAELLSSSSLLSAISNSPSTIHPSLAVSHQALQATLSENMDLAEHLLELEAVLGGQRASTQAQLLATHALERQWQSKQSDMDHALAPFSPASLYQQLGHGVQEQSAVCQAMEESFLDGGEGGNVTEREVAEWVRKYREARVLYYLRQERKERWDEGRVGGWR